MASKQEIPIFEISDLNKILEHLADSMFPGKDVEKTKYIH